MASKELEITLTGKNCGQEERAPMCGVPYHAVDAISEQAGQQRAIRWRSANRWRIRSLRRALSKREVIRIVTPGTNLDTQVTWMKAENNYLMCIAYTEDKIGIAVADVSDR